MGHELLNDLEPEVDQTITDLSSQFWRLAEGDSPSGFAMIEMAEILREIAVRADSLPTIIVRQLRPEPVDFETLKVAYLAENFWLHNYIRTNDFYPPGYSEARDSLMENRTAQLEVRDTSETGQGLYAREKIKKGVALFMASGKREVSCSPYEARGGRNPDELLPNAICIGQEDLESMVGMRTQPPDIKANIWLDPHYTSPLRFLDHSCEPNVKRSADGLTFVAMRDIEPNEPLTCDYATLEVNPKWRMACKCGSAHCRKVIGSIQSLPDELLGAYSRDLPPFMLDLFRESHPETSREVYDGIRWTRAVLGCKL